MSTDLAGVKHFTYSGVKRLTLFAV